MAKNCKYVSKLEVKEYKKIMEETIPKVKADLKKEYGKSCTHMIVGSAKRNLILQKGESHWDVDYQFYLQALVFHTISPFELKKCICQSFKRHLGKKYSVRLSTSVITICKMHDIGKHAIKSFDVAIIKTNQTTGYKEILRGTNPNNSFWEELKKNGDTYERRREIRGSEQWKKFREIFINKKCVNMNNTKDEQKPTFSLYLETIKDTLEHFGEW